MQYSLLINNVVEIIGGLFFLITAIYIIKDKLRCDRYVAGKFTPETRFVDILSWEISRLTFSPKKMSYDYILLVFHRYSEMPELKFCLGQFWGAQLSYFFGAETSNIFLHCTKNASTMVQI